MELMYSCDGNGDLLIVDAANEQLIWRGWPEGRRVEKVGRLSDLSDCIILVEWESGGKNVPNLWRYSYDRGIVWRAQLPQSGSDVYVDFRLDNGDLYANSWSGYRVKISPITGQIISKTFTK